MARRKERWIGMSRSWISGIPGRVWLGLGDQVGVVGRMPLIGARACSIFQRVYHLATAYLLLVVRNLASMLMSFSLLMTAIRSTFCGQTLLKEPTLRKMRSGRTKPPPPPPHLSYTSAELSSEICHFNHWSHEMWEDHRLWGCINLGKCPRCATL